MEQAGTQAAGRLRVGVAVLHLGDLRALAVTMRSLAALTDGADRVLVLQQPFGRREGGPIDHVTDAPSIRVDPPVNPRTVALGELSDCDLILFVREGVAFGPSVIAVERDRFATAPELRAALLTSRKKVTLDAYLASGDLADPFGALRSRGVLAQRFAPRYFAPSMLTVATKRGPLGTFETYASRSEWASSRLFLDGMRDAPIVEASSSAFGLIANDPDRRDTELHGREACEALARFSAAYPSYARLAASDMRRLVLQQLVGLARGSRPRTRLRFLKGILAGLRNGAAVRRRVSRDISDLA